MSDELEHIYQVTIRTGRGDQAYNVRSNKGLDDYRRGLLSGMYAIVTPYLRPGEAIQVTDQNLVGITEMKTEAEELSAI
jgi:hypothetical protein